MKTTDHGSETVVTTDTGRTVYIVNRDGTVYQCDADSTWVETRRPSYESALAWVAKRMPEEDEADASWDTLIARLTSVAGFLSDDDDRADEASAVREAINLIRVHAIPQDHHLAEK